MMPPDLTTYFQQGQNAGLCGKSLDDCPYKKPERKVVWVRGFHHGKLISQQKLFTSKQQEQHLAHIANLRRLFEE